jgi:hypothetical protein
MQQITLAGPQVPWPDLRACCLNIADGDGGGQAPDSMKKHQG